MRMGCAAKAVGYAERRGLLSKVVMINDTPHLDNHSLHFDSLLDIQQIWTTIKTVNSFSSM